jgi:hypothetical protein
MERALPLEQMIRRVVTVMASLSLIVLFSACANTTAGDLRNTFVGEPPLAGTGEPPPPPRVLARVTPIAPRDAPLAGTGEPPP